MQHDCLGDFLSVRVYCPFWILFYRYNKLLPNSVKPFKFILLVPESFGIMKSENETKKRILHKENEKVWCVKLEFGCGWKFAFFFAMYHIKTYFANILNLKSYKLLLILLCNHMILFCKSIERKDRDLYNFQIKSRVKIVLICSTSKTIPCLPLYKSFNLYFEKKFADLRENMRKSGKI